MDLLSFLLPLPLTNQMMFYKLYKTYDYIHIFYIYLLYILDTIYISFLLFSLIQYSPIYTHDLLLPIHYTFYIFWLHISHKSRSHYLLNHYTHFSDIKYNIFSFYMFVLFLKHSLMLKFI